jgi:hypothetical protein
MDLDFSMNLKANRRWLIKKQAGIQIVLNPLSNTDIRKFLCSLLYLKIGKRILQPVDIKVFPKPYFVSYLSV